MSSEKITKNCPYCGEINKLNVVVKCSSSGAVNTVRCFKCLHDGPTGATSKEAIDLFNSRHAGQVSWSPSAEKQLQDKANFFNDNH